MTRREKLHRVRKRFIETARPELIDETVMLLAQLRPGGTLGVSRGVLAYALACCGMKPKKVAVLRRRWLDASEHLEDSFLTFVIKETAR